MDGRAAVAVLQFVANLLVRAGTAAGNENAQESQRKGGGLSAAQRHLTDESVWKLLDAALAVVPPAEAAALVTGAANGLLRAMHSATTAALRGGPQGQRPTDMLQAMQAVAKRLREKHAAAFQPPLAAVGAWLGRAAELYDSADANGRAGAAGLFLESLACWAAVAAAASSQRKELPGPAAACPRARTAVLRRAPAGG